MFATRFSAAARTAQAQAVPARFFSINKTIIQGKVVRDGDVLGTGKKVGRVTVVTERVVGKKDDGTFETVGDFHNVVGFDEGLVQKIGSVKKGDSVYLEGETQTNTWENDKGEKVYKQQIVVPKFGGVFKVVGRKPAAEAE